MPFIAVVGGGALGGALAHKLAARNRVPEVRLIDPEGRIAQGKALDILQAAPLEQFSTRITFAETLIAAAGADAIVVADDAGGSVEHSGEPGLALLRQLTRAIDRTPIICAGASQRELIGRAVGELRLAAHRIVGSAPFALESAVRALAGVALDLSGVEVSLRIVGVPPASAVVAWEEAAAFGAPITAQLPPHVIAMLNRRMPSLWPPGPYVLAAAAARVAEAIAVGARRRFSCFVAMDAGPLRGTVVAMPIEAGPSGVMKVIEPALTRQERTMLENAARA